MLCKTRGIVLHRIKYSESSIIAKIYTEQSGLCSFLIQGARKKKSNSRSNLIQPLSLIELVYYFKENAGLQRVRELKNDYPFSSVHDDISKTSVALFLSEMLVRSIKEESANQPLFAFLTHSIKYFDATENPASFHLLFLIKLSRFLGFYPQDSHGEERPFFDLPEGVFIREKPDHIHFLSPDISKPFRQMISMDYDELGRITMDWKTRKTLLEKLIEYYRLHITGLKEIKSHQILETVLRD